ncbi:hypothetical protein ILYODFUR_031809 [Ilyodon furcidens]|uniref:Uncharacterized protein n=1 Tax=Ilyodon furcidens TaxID=33524 RepID=A0ABV0TEI4_9TELE
MLYQAPRHPKALYTTISHPPTETLTVVIYIVAAQLPSQRARWCLTTWVSPTLPPETTETNRGGGSNQQPTDYRTKHYHCRPSTSHNITTRFKCGLQKLSFTFFVFKPFGGKFVGVLQIVVLMHNLCLLELKVTN